MTPKQARFCEEYIVDMNGAAAAIRAGFAEAGAAVTASRLLTNPNIALRVKELRQVQSIRTEISADYVLQGLQEVALRCMQKVPVMEWDYENKCLVQKKDEEGKDVWTFDSSGANKALELLGKHTGIFEKDNNQKRTLIAVAINPD